jgi:hypothetical protein
LFVNPGTACAPGDFRIAGPVGPADSPGIWENQSSSDPVLSDLLDQVIDIVPESIIAGKSQCHISLVYMENGWMRCRLPASSGAKSQPVIANKFF